MLYYSASQEGEESGYKNTSSRYGESFIYFGKSDGSEGQWYEAKDPRTITVPVNGKDTTFTISWGNNVCIKAYTKDVNVDVEPSEITVGSESLLLAEGEQQDVKANVYPMYAKDRILTYTSSNTEIATVDAEGVVTGVKDGTATITITQPKKNLTKEVQVTVYKNPTKISWNVGQVEMNVGESKELPNITIEPVEASKVPVTYTSSNENVVVIKGEKIVAKGNGEATLTATAKNGITATCKVVVTTKTTGIEVEQDTYTVSCGKSVQMKAKVLPETASNQKLTYESLNQEIFSVDEKGLITTKKDGIGKVRISQGDFAKEITIQVLPVAKSIAFSESKSYRLETNGIKTAQLPSIVFDPISATSKDVMYTSSAESVVTVDENGKLTAVGNGEATITASYWTGENMLTTTNECKVEVVTKTTEIVVDKTSVVMEEDNGDSISAYVLPEDASDTTLTYESSNEKVVTVDEWGNLTAGKVGTATITVRQGSLKKEVKVTVKPVAKSLGIINYEIAMTEGQTTKLQAVVDPVELESEITWTSSNAKIASVDSKGRVTAKKSGVVTIIASLDGLEDCAMVTVKSKVQKPKTPKVNSVKATAYNKLKLSFTKTDTTEIYRATSKKGAYQKRATTKEGTYTDTVKTGQTYYYKIRTKKNGMYSDYSAVIQGKTSLGSTKITKTISKDGSTKITWNKISGATTYEVYRATSKNGKYTLEKTVKTTNWTDGKIVGGNTYYYKVRGVRDGVRSAYSQAKSQLATLKKVSVVAKKKTLSWQKISGAKGYEVYTATTKNGKYKKVATTTKTTYKTSKKTAYYQVRAYYLKGKTKVYGAFSSTKKA